MSFSISIKWNINGIVRGLMLNSGIWESFLLRTLPISHRFITWQDHNTSFLAPFSLIEKVLSVPASAETDHG
ncbi:MAG TPA: hypothetical protein VLA71_10880 [Algoriphagus sp.]|nr:hypothetical protein [Algoriphagus sp.]